MAIGSTHQADLWAKQALQRMTEHGVAPLPLNYTLYFHYFADDISNLKTALDLIAASEKMTQQHCTALYRKFFVDGEESKDSNSIIDTELKKVVELMNQAAQGQTQYGENLTSFSDKLEGSPTLEVLRGAMEKITVETQAVAHQNRHLQQELHQTSAQLQDMRSNFDRIHREAQVDPLTGVGNRKFLDTELTRAVQEAHQHQALLSVLMIDIDHFKKFNDSYGHQVGDNVLRLVARTLVENLKGRDVIARYGGEEFCILLPQTRLEDAERLANQLRISLASKQIRKKGSTESLGSITISLGAAEITVSEKDEELIARADAALYKAKQSGRNKVVCDTSRRKLSE